MKLKNTILEIVTQYKLAILYFKFVSFFLNLNKYVKITLQFFFNIYLLSLLIIQFIEMDLSDLFIKIIKK